MANPIVEEMMEYLDENGPLSTLTKDLESFRASTLDSLCRAYPTAPCTLIDEALEGWVAIVWQR